MKEFFRRIKWESLITALFAVIIGIVFLAVPEKSSTIVCYVAGVIFILLGAILLTRYLVTGLLFGSHLFVTSIILIALGILCLTKVDLVKSIYTVIFGIFLIADGLFKFKDGIDCASEHIKGSWSLFVVAVLSMILGFLVMFDTFDSVIVFAGISLIVDGVCDFVTTLVFSSHLRKTEKAIKNFLSNSNF